MEKQTKRLLVVTGLAAGAAAFVLLLSSRSSAETKKASSGGGGTNPPRPSTPSQPSAPSSPDTPSQPQPAPSLPAGTTWRRATQAEANTVKPRYDYFLTQPMGTEAVEQHGGRTWKFVVCSGQQCNPPSTSQKDVRGFVAA